MFYYIKFIKGVCMSINYGSNNELMSFLNKYDCSLFNVSTADEADIFLLGEDHNSISCKTLNGSLVSGLAKSYTVTLFLEGEPSMLALDVSKFVSIIKNMPLDSPSPLFENTIMKGKSIIQSIPLLPPETLLCAKQVFGWDMKDMDKLNGRDPKLQEKLLQLKALQEEQIRNYTEQMGLLLNEFQFDLTEQGGTENPPYPLANKAMNAFSRLFYEREQVESELEKTKQILAEKVLTLDLIQSTFQKRTQAMISTLQKISILLEHKVFIGKMVFISGVMHLKTAKTNSERPEYNLDSFFNEIKNHKAAILIPKECNV